MSNKLKRLHKLLNEREEWKQAYRKYSELKLSYLTGERDLQEDFPSWSHVFHKTPMDWIEWRIYHAELNLNRCKKEINKVYKEDLEMSLADILDKIDSDGIIIGIKI